MFIVLRNGKTTKLSEVRGAKLPALMTSSSAVTMFETKVAAQSALKRTRRWMQTNAELFVQLTGTNPEDNVFTIVAAEKAE